MENSAEIKLKIRFIMLIAKALHRYGASADRIENALTIISQKLNINANYFSLPTSIMGNFKISEDDEFTRMERLDPGKINLEKLYFADKTVDDVIDEKISVKDGIARVKFIIDKAPLHSDFASIVAIIILASNVSLILGGNIFDSLLSAFIGLLIGIINSEVKIERIDTISEAIIAFITAFIAMSFSVFYPGLHPNIVILASLIYFVPGLSLTMAIGEISSQNLTAGTARLVGALVILFKLAFGTYLGSILSQYFFMPEMSEIETIHPLVKFISLLFISFSFVINFQARWQETFWIMLAGISTYYINSLIASQLGLTASALIAGTYIGAGSNLYARVLNRPSMIVSLPAIILLVPGSIGFKGIEFLFSQNALEGVNTLFNTLTIGLALVAGTYFGSIIIRPKRSL